MTTVTRTFDRPITEVFDALADPRTYPRWLVGAKQMRSIDPTWPAPGAAFHHRVGLVGPLTVADSSSSLAVRAPELLVLEVRARPFGRARVTFELKATDVGTTEVSFSEVPIGATRVLTPLAAPLAVARNHRSLDHLATYLQERSGERTGSA